MKHLDHILEHLPRSIQFIDTHCHLDMSAYTDDLEDVLNQAFTNHIHKIITIGVDLASSRNAIALARRHQQVSATIGIHPHDVNNLQKCDYTELEQLYIQYSEHVVGFGEIGLDYVKQHSHPSKQREHFKTVRSCPCTQATGSDPQQRCQ